MKKVNSIQAAHGQIQGLISARYEVAAVVFPGSDPSGPNRDGASAPAAESRCGLSLLLD